MKSKVAMAVVSSLFLFFLFSIPANAEQTRSYNVYRKLSFSNYAAICKCEVASDSPSDWISVTMELWRGNTMLNSWSSAGLEYVSLDETESVTRYHSYRLEIHYSVNGVPQPSIETNQYYG